MQEHRILSSILNMTIRKHPAMLPVSLSRDKIAILQSGYIMSPKSDGIRAFLFIGTNHSGLQSAWLYYRNETLEKIYCNETNTDVCRLSIFDVEVKPKPQYRIEIFDALLIDNHIFTSHCVTIRIEAMRKFLHEQIINNHEKDNYSRKRKRSESPSPSPSPSAHKKNHKHYKEQHSSSDSEEEEKEEKKDHYHYQKQQHWSDKEYESIWSPKIYPTSFKSNLIWYLDKWFVCAKPTFPPHHLRDIFNCFPDCDGWIFTRILEKYRPYRTNMEACIKWKPNHLMTIDFEIEPKTYQSLQNIIGIKSKFTKETNGHFILSVVSASGKRMYFAFANLPRHIELKCNIGEFMWDENKNKWCFIRFRQDKSEPNTVETAVATIKDMNQNLSIKELATTLYLPFKSKQHWNLLK